MLSTLSVRVQHVSAPLPRLSVVLCRPTPCLNHRGELQHSPKGAIAVRGYRSQAPPHEPFKILYLGRDEFSCLVLEQLHKSKDVWQELAIVTTPDMKVGRRGSELAVSPLKLLGQQHNLPVHYIPPGKDKSTLKTWQPPSPFSEPGTPSPSSHIIITASFGRILPKSILDLFLPGRRLNVHPSLLPVYRGAAPIQHAIKDGLQETGVCIIDMLERSKGIDAGAIWGEQRVTIPEGAAFADLRDNLARTGGQLLVSVLRDMIAGKAMSKPQAEDPAAPRASFITLEDAQVDFDTMTAEQIARHSRAFSHQHPLTATLKSKRTLQLHSTSVYDGPSDVLKQLPIPGTAIFDRSANALLIRCASDTILSVPQVKQQDRTLLKAREWWNGVRPDLRLQVGNEGPIQFLRPASVRS